MSTVRPIVLMFFVLILFIGISGCSGTQKTHANNTTAAVMVWQQEYSWPGWMDSSNDLVQTGDGGFAVTGQKTVIREDAPKYEKNSTHMFLLRTDWSGRELWNLTYGEDGSSGSIVRAVKDGFIMMGQDGSGGVLLVGTDYRGRVLWNRTYERDGYSRGCSLITADDGGYVFSGNAGQTITGQSVLAVKTDARGNVQWDRTYRTGYGYSIVKATDGGYVIVGDGISGIGMFVIRIDASGNELWNRSYNSSRIFQTSLDSQDSYTIYTGLFIVPAGDGGYVLSGVANTISENLTVFLVNGTSQYDLVRVNHPFLIKIDSTGNVSWARAYGGKNDFDTVRALIKTRDGGYAIAGMGSIDAGARLPHANIYRTKYYPVHVIKTDANGTEIWSGNYRYKDYNECTGMIQASDGSYVITGWTLPENRTAFNYDIFLMKVA